MGYVMLAHLAAAFVACGIGTLIEYMETENDDEY